MGRGHLLILKKYNTQSIGSIDLILFSVYRGTFKVFISLSFKNDILKVATVLVNTLRELNLEISVHFFDWGVFFYPNLKKWMWGCVVLTGCRHGSQLSRISYENTSPEGLFLLGAIFRYYIDYFLRGYLKSLVYTNRPRTPDQPKDNIRAAIGAGRGRFRRGSTPF